MSRRPPVPSALLVRALRPQPSDWVALSLTAGLSATAGQYTPAWRQRGDIIEFCGGIAGASILNNTTLCTLPVGSRPASNLNLVCQAGTNGAARINIQTSGAMVIFTAATVTGLNLDGLSFRLV